jgi:hypothetical protein
LLRLDDREQKRARRDCGHEYSWSIHRDTFSD